MNYPTKNSPLGSEILRGREMDGGGRKGFKWKNKRFNYLFGGVGKRSCWIGFSEGVGGEKKMVLTNGEGQIHRPTLKCLRNQSGRQTVTNRGRNGVRLDLPKAFTAEWIAGPLSATESENGEIGKFFWLSALGSGDLKELKLRRENSKKEYESDSSPRVQCGRNLGKKLIFFIYQM